MKSPRHGKRTTSYAEDCAAMRELLSLIGDKWSVLVVVNLGSGSMRFSELKRGIDGISQRMLTTTLRDLERNGLVSRAVTASIPPRVDYALTALGESLLEPVEVLATWAQANRPRVEKARSAFDRRATPSRDE